MPQRALYPIPPHPGSCPSTRRPSSGSPASADTRPSAAFYHASLAKGERYHLRQLLNHVVRLKSFEDLRRYEGIIQPTFKTACLARGPLLDAWACTRRPSASFPTLCVGSSSPFSPPTKSPLPSTCRAQGPLPDGFGHQHRLVPHGRRSLQRRPTRHRGVPAEPPPSLPRSSPCPFLVSAYPSLLPSSHTGAPLGHPLHVHPLQVQPAPRSDSSSVMVSHSSSARSAASIAPPSPPRWR